VTLNQGLYYGALLGMRVKLRGTSLALKARHSKALGWNEEEKALKGRNRQTVPPFQGLTFILSCTPGFQSPLSRALESWGVLLRAFSALVYGLA
jgi:hypothetical protein